jgi:hypothetical protein
VVYVDKGHALQSIHPLSLQLTNIMFSLDASGSLFKLLLASVYLAPPAFEVS